jgi:predicted phage terminase large subunit-like protein
LTRKATNEFYDRTLTKAKKLGDKALRMVMRELVLKDRFFLLTRVLKRIDADSDWAYARCREVEADPDYKLDLWAREHYKSTIITFAGSIQEICKNPEITIGIFSFNRPIAKSFLKQIMTELESNHTLHWLFPEIFWSDPKKQSKKYGFKWSGNEGITVKRKGNPKEQTVEAWGVIEAQPTSKHFTLLIYNDIVTDTTVMTASMREKAIAGWRLSQNLGSKSTQYRQWYEGTIYHPYDTYHTILKSGKFELGDIEDKVTIRVTPRIYPATDNGKVTGNPVYMSKAELGAKYRMMGPYIFAAQMLLDPLQEDKQGFAIEWIKKWPAEKFKGLNIMILCDPASKRGKRNDYTVFFVIGLGPDKNYYVIDIIRDKLSLTERATALFRLHQKYKPIFVGYEEAAMQTDKEHFEYVMEQHNYRFTITSLREGPSESKNARIQSLVPLFEQGRIYLPEKLEYTDYEYKTFDIVEAFIEQEYVIFPFIEHDDMLDTLAKINHKDIFIPFPEGTMEEVYGFTGDSAIEHDEEVWDVYAS